MGCVEVRKPSLKTVIFNIVVIYDGLRMFSPVTALFILIGFNGQAPDRAVQRGSDVKNQEICPALLPVH